MELIYDLRDLEYAERRADLRFEWLSELGAVSLQSLKPDASGFLFGYQVPRAEYVEQLGNQTNIADRPADREQLARLEDILAVLHGAGINLPSPRTWRLEVDSPLPGNLTYPLFVRTSTSSWKRGGQVSKVHSRRQLLEECELLRRAFSWDATILAREWLELAVAGDWRYGPVPAEVRVWIVDSIPFAWSFHYLHIVPNPKGFPPSAAELSRLAEYAGEFASPFSSRLIAADFVRDLEGRWKFLEAGPGACCGTAHELVFKAVASKLIGREVECPSDATGGLMPVDRPDEHR